MPDGHRYRQRPVRRLHRHRVLLLLLACLGIGLGLGVLVWRHRSASLASPRLSQPTIVPQTNVATSQSSIAGYQLVIAKLGIRAPLILNVSGTDETTYLTALQNGVAQYLGTAQPGGTGNMVVFGHSSYYRTKPGNYKEVFKRLDQLTVGDPIVIRLNGRPMFTYRVTGSRVVEATDLSVLQPSSAKELTLLTCWPPGTTDKRYVVTAQLAAS